MFKLTKIFCSILTHVLYKKKEAGYICAQMGQMWDKKIYMICLQIWYLLFLVQACMDSQCSILSSQACIGTLCLFEVIVNVKYSLLVEVPSHFNHVGLLLHVERNHTVVPISPIKVLKKSTLGSC